MAITLNSILVDNFKSYNQPQWIDCSNLSVFMGANSSGKSTAIQTILAIKQTVECNSPNIDLLLSGKYVTLGDYNDIVNDINKEDIRIGVALDCQSEVSPSSENTRIEWIFRKDHEKKPKLYKLDFIIGENSISLCKDNHEAYYSINIDNKRTSLLVDLDNLKIGKVYIEYDDEFNKIFHELLNWLLKTLSQNKKSSRIEKRKMMALQGIDDFYFLLLRSKGGGQLELKAPNDGAINECAENIINIMEEYASFQFEGYKKYVKFPDIIQPHILYSFLNDLPPETLTVINEYIDSSRKRKAIFVGSIDENTISKKVAALSSSIDSFNKNLQSNNNPEFDKIAEVFLLYEQFWKDVLANVFYVGPIREKPQGLYNIGFESVPKYVGTTGAYFASVLLHQKQEKEYILPNNEIEKINLWDALAQWVAHLNIANEVFIEQRNSFGFSVSVENMQEKKSDIMNVGIGTSQVLPVLITGLLSEKNETLIFEQPELHLHPFSQSRLADFFVMLAKNGRRIIIETHSEYMLLRLRYHVLVENILEKDIIINFFQNDKGTKVKCGKLSSYGNLEYPDDFKDETQKLINELMIATMVKGKKDATERID